MAKPPIIDDEPNDEPARYHPPGGSQAGGPVVSDDIMKGMTDLEKAQASVLAKMNRESVKLYKRIEKLEEALKPFAAYTTPYIETAPEDGMPANTPHTAGDYRRARAALAKARGEA